MHRFLSYQYNEPLSNVNYPLGAGDQFLRWRLEHKNLTKDPQDGNIYANATVVVENTQGIMLSMYESGMEEYYQSSRNALMDTAYRLEEMARQMRTQAERLR